MARYPEKIVRFDAFCPTCVWKDNTEDEEPCCKCLASPSNENSVRPVYYKEAKKK